MAIANRTQYAALRDLRHHRAHGKPHTDRRALAQEGERFQAALKAADGQAAVLLGDLKARTADSVQNAPALLLLGL